MANSDVKLKHKVQLRRKVEEPTDEKPIVDPVPHSTRETSKSKMWIWVLVGIVVLLIIGYFIFTRSENTVQTPIEVESTFVPSDTNESIKVTSEETKGTEPKLSEENHTDIEDPSTSEAPTEPTPVTLPINTSVTNNVSNDVEAEAMKVIRGDYGVGQERKNKLGERYQTIQNRVNELKHEGVF